MSRAYAPVRFVRPVTPPYGKGPGEVFYRARQCATNRRATSGDAAQWVCR